MSMGRIIGLVILVILALVGVVASGQLLEGVEADQNAVIVSPVAGELTWYTTPGLVWQGFGTPTHYHKRGIYRFEQDCSIKDKAGNCGGGIVLRFVDGGHGTIFGSVQYELPADPAHLTSLHTKYRGEPAVQRDLIKTIVDKAVYLTGTLMSSKESYAEKRNDLIRFVEDQIQHGVYRTRQVTEWVTDPVTNEKKQVTKGEIIMDRNGQPERQEDSVLDRFGITTYNFAISSMPYDDAVEAQIKQQQQIAMDIQTSAAKAKMAEQRAITAERDGVANATETRWKQEAIKAQAVTAALQEKEVQETNAKREQIVQVIAAQRDKEVAETAAKQRLAVAELDKKAAEQTKAQQILLGEGEAARKKLVIEADGALEAKLTAYREVTPKIFEALRGSPMVSTVNLGGGASAGASATALPLIDLLTAKVAKDLALDMSVPAGGRAPVRIGETQR